MSHKNSEKGTRHSTNAAQDTVHTPLSKEGTSHTTRMVPLNDLFHRQQRRWYGVLINTLVPMLYSSDSQSVYAQGQVFKTHVFHVPLLVYIATYLDSYDTISLSLLCRNIYITWIRYPMGYNGWPLPESFSPISRDWDDETGSTRLNELKRNTLSSIETFDHLKRSLQLILPRYLFDVLQLTYVDEGHISLFRQESVLLYLLQELVETAQELYHRDPPMLTRLFPRSSEELGHFIKFSLQIGRSERCLPRCEFYKRSHQSA